MADKALLETAVIRAACDYSHRPSTETRDDLDAAVRHLDAVAVARSSTAEPAAPTADIQAAERAEILAGRAYNDSRRNADNHVATDDFLSIWRDAIAATDAARSPLPTREEMSGVVHFDGLCLRPEAVQESGVFWLRWVADYMNRSDNLVSGIALAELRTLADELEARK